MSSKKFKDHREIGKQLELFFFDESSPGSVYWLPKGMIIFKVLEKFIREVTEKKGYQEISTPIIVKSSLFKQSGHWQFFHENMFNFKIDNEEWSIKPMNCPEATVVYKFKTRSYKDLPLRLSELGRLHRNELTGTLNGLFRVRQLVMDDAHVFCRFDQIQSEIAEMLETTLNFYQKLNLPVSFGLATKPEKALGSEADWKNAQEQLSNALSYHKINFEVLEGEGAFYGPKIHIDFKDLLGRKWTLATIQVDFQMPQKMRLFYINEKGDKSQPVMIHRAIFGSFERFVGILTEVYQGAFPLWISPVQIVVLPVSEKNNDYAQEVSEKLKKNNLRVEVDIRNETLPAKIRHAIIQKVPYIVIVGNKEEKTKKLSVRTREGEEFTDLEITKFIQMIETQIANTLTL